MPTKQASNVRATALSDFALAKKKAFESRLPGVVLVPTRVALMAVSWATVPVSLVVRALLAVVAVGKAVVGAKKKTVDDVMRERNKGKFPPVMPAPGGLAPWKEREFHVVVYGVTGFAGRLAVEHLARTYGVGGDVKWAVAARRVDAAEKIKAQVASKLSIPAVTSVPVIKADSGDEATLLAMCARTRVVVTTVGPFQLYGTPLVRAAIACGTSYCDITGEVDWVRGLIDHYDEAARASGARIVSLCGHDSVPWDITVLACATQLPEGEELAKVTAYDEGVGMPSGGTIATVLESIPPIPYKSRAGFDPLMKLPSGEKSSFATKVNIVTVPTTAKRGAMSFFVMAPVNGRAVARSNALNGYGSKLVYREGVLHPSLAHAVAQTCEMAALGPVLAFPGDAKYLVLPRPGEGPSEAIMDKSFLQVTTVGVGSKGTKVGCRLFLPHDPGYRDTARILVEAGLAIALESERMLIPGGVTTPGSCQGMVLLERIVNTGSSFAWLSPEDVDSFGV